MNNQDCSLCRRPTKDDENFVFSGYYRYCEKCQKEIEKELSVSFGYNKPQYEIDMIISLYLENV